MGYLDTFDFEGEYITWTTDGANAGTVFHRDGRFNCTNVCGTIKLKSDDHRFVAMVLSRAAPRHVSRHLGNPKLMNDVMKRVTVPLPPTIEEQHAIARALGDVDALLGALEQLIAKKRDLRQAAMQQLLTGQTRLPGFTGEWEVRRLLDCARFLSGTYLAQDAYRDGEFEVQGAGSLMGRHCAANYPEPISVVGRVGTVGRPRFMPNGCWVNNNAAAIVAISGKASPVFIHLLLMTVDWSKATSVTAQPFLVIGSLMDMTFQIPPLPEQSAITEVLSDMDAELVALEQRLAKTRALKQGMMQELLTGRTRLL